MNNISRISIPKMDCASEEQMVRMRLDQVANIIRLEFDLSLRELTVVHQGTVEEIMKALAPLNFGSRVLTSEATEDAVLEGASDETSEGKVLKQLLAINAAMFVFEIGLGIYANSTGLISDSLDMFADAAVYGMSLFAVGKALRYKQKAARLSGYVQLTLAALAIFEVVRRSIYGSEPHAPLMMAVAFLALVANVSCLVLLSKHREGAVHMKASWIFSTNDVIANLGVVVAGAFVYFTLSAWPDLITGAVIAAVVFSGAIRILRVSKSGAQ